MVEDGGMVLAAVLALVGLFVLYRGARETLHLRRLRRDGRQATGTVVDHEVGTRRAKAVVVAWTDEWGETRRVKSSLSSSRPTFGLGEPVTVRYLPGDPAAACIDERRENARSAVLVLVIGVGFSAAAAWLAFGLD
jgi:hypothetical protein